MLVSVTGCGSPEGNALSKSWSGLETAYVSPSDAGMFRDWTTLVGCTDDWKCFDDLQGSCDGLGSYVKTANIDKRVSATYDLSEVADNSRITDIELFFAIANGFDGTVNRVRAFFIYGDDLVAAPAYYTLPNGTTPGEGNYVVNFSDLELIKGPTVSTMELGLIYESFEGPKPAVVLSQAFARFRYTPPPTQPGNFTATYVAGSPPSVHLTWADGPDETGYNVERSTDGGATYAPLMQGLPANTTSADDSALPWPVAMDMVLYYRISAFDSATGLTSLQSVPATVPWVGRPSGVSVTPTNNAHSMRVNWLDRSNNETAITVHRKLSACGGSGAVTDYIVAANATSYTILTGDLPFSGTHCYWVTATAPAPAGESPVSNQVPYTTAAAPLPPTIVTAEYQDISVTPYSQVYVDWNTSPGATEYTVRRNGGALTPAVVQTNFSDPIATPVPFGTVYEYCVEPYGEGSVAPSCSAVVSVSSIERPVRLTATYDAATNRTLVTWLDNDTNGTGFQVKRHAGPCDGTRNGFSSFGPGWPAGTTSYEIVGGNGYCYRVVAKKTGFPDSEMSNEDGA